MRPPATLSLEADVVARVEVTAEVPHVALAFSVDRVTFRIDGIDPPPERIVELSVTKVVDLLAGARRTFRFELTAKGPHTLLLTSARGVEVERTVRVFRSGTPAPGPFRLSTRLSAGVDLMGGWDTSLKARGIGGVSPCGALADPSQTQHERTVRKGPGA